MITGGLLVTVGVILGVALRSLPARRRPAASQVNRCSCGDPWSMHDPEGSHHCNAATRTMLLGETIRCDCVQYDGPEPLPRLYNWLAP